MFNITQDRTFTWTVPTTRTDGTPIKGMVSFILDITKADGTLVKSYTGLTGTSTVLNPSKEGWGAGSYVAYARAVEDYNGSGLVSARSTGVPFDLEVVVAPNPPTNLKVS